MTRFGYSVTISKEGAYWRTEVRQHVSDTLVIVLSVALGSRRFARRAANLAGLLMWREGSPDLLSDGLEDGLPVGDPVLHHKKWSGTFRRFAAGQPADIDAEGGSEALDDGEGDAL